MTHEWTGKKVIRGDINGGVEYVAGVDIVRAEDVNAAINNSLYAVDIVDSIDADSTYANRVGTPHVDLIKEPTTGRVTLRFIELKGEPGKTGGVGPTGPNGVRGMSFMRYPNALTTSTTTLTKSSLSGDAAYYGTLYVGEQIMDNTGKVFVVQETTTSSTIKVAYKMTLKGEQGIQGTAGTNGKSAYEIWLAAGNTGTEQDFLNSLKGASITTIEVVSA